MTVIANQEEATSESRVEVDAVYLHIAVTDPEVLTALKEYEGAEQRKYVELALKIGVQALRGAKGVIDGEQIRSSGEKLIAQLTERLQGHRDLMDQSIQGTLRSYFDPASGHFVARVTSLTNDDGELAQLVRRQMSGESDKLRQLLDGFIGPNGELVKLLAPGEGNAFVQDLQSKMQLTMDAEREAMIAQFSLDHQDSALSRLVRELKRNHGDVSDALTTKMTSIVDEFSLDKPDSALSRLVGRVEQAQNSISNEFTLDRPESALRKLRDHLVDSIAQGQKSQEDFQQSVLQILSSLQAQKKAEARSTTHGLIFEESVGGVVSEICSRQNDVFEATGSGTGTIRNCKVGDFVVTLGPDNAAAGSKIVVEAKEDSSYTIRKTLDEADEARRNRSADICLFVHSKRTAPQGLEPITRFGHDIVVLWDTDDQASDINIKAGMMVAKAMSVRRAQQSNKEATSWTAIDRAIEVIRKQLESFTELKTTAETIERAAVKSLDRIRIMAKALDNALDEIESNLVGVRKSD